MTGFLHRTDPPINLSMVGGLNSEMPNHSELRSWNVLKFVHSFCLGVVLPTPLEV